jgi:hypothetical protein
MLARETNKRMKKPLTPVIPQLSRSRRFFCIAACSGRAGQDHARAQPPKPDIRLQRNICRYGPILLQKSFEVAGEQ